MKGKILNDHQQIGKKLKPPLVTLENLVEVGWVDLILPDLIWIAIIRTKLGNNIGTEVVNKFISISTKHETQGFNVYAFLRSYENLPLENKLLIIEDLNREGVLSIILDCLREFLIMYPSCPLNFLRPIDEVGPVDSEFIIKFKEVLIELIDKRSILSTFTLANVMYSLLLLDRIVVEPSSTLRQFSKIQEYPNTEISKLIASELRAIINAFYSKELFENETSNWAKDFWNRGIELEPCKI